MHGTDVSGTNDYLSITVSQSLVTDVHVLNICLLVLGFYTGAKPFLGPNCMISYMVSYSSDPKWA